jgi:chemotaxis protein CheY-P-specific phosphatase CheC
MSGSSDRLPEPMQVAALVQQVVWAYLGESAQLSDTRPPPDLPRWTGCVMLEGRFRGVVTVSASRELALRIGGRMFAAEPADLSDDQARDAFAEFTNVIGGNLKALISTQVGQTCSLCLPFVAGGPIQIPGPTRRREADFVFGDQRLAVDVFEIVDQG